LSLELILLHWQGLAETAASHSGSHGAGSSGRETGVAKLGLAICQEIVQKKPAPWWRSDIFMVSD
jgi:hypothetical protein